VQATWLGYLTPPVSTRSTTDHRPPGESGRAPRRVPQRALAEVADCQWCYQAPLDCPQVASPPSTRGVWLLSGHFPASPRSDLGSSPYEPVTEAPARCSIAHRGAGSGHGTRGVSLPLREPRRRPRRVDLRDFQSFPDYLAMHEEVDVMLDTFLHRRHDYCHACGSSASAGRTRPSRGGRACQGDRSGRTCVDTPEQYLDTVCGLASDLSGFRCCVRDADPNVGVGSHGRHALYVSSEQAYRSMWRRWCEAREETGE